MASNFDNIENINNGEGDRIKERARNTKQDIDIAKMLIDIGWIRGKIENIEKAVFNEIPHQLEEMKKESAREREELRKELMYCIDGVNRDIKEINNRLLYGFLILIASSLILQIVLKFFT